MAPGLNFSNTIASYLPSLVRVKGYSIRTLLQNLSNFLFLLTPRNTNTINVSSQMQKCLLNYKSEERPLWTSLKSENCAGWEVTFLKRRKHVCCSVKRRVSNEDSRRFQSRRRTSPGWKRLTFNTQALKLKYSWTFSWRWSQLKRPIISRHRHNADILQKYLGVVKYFIFK